ncbi:MAG: hypothetical protein [Caudoviricetes sp.]|nr:MAG: hypothetical protein [Caudoviricetes sp.]
MFQGLNGFKWFEGVVEDRFDPLELGRVRVRVYGMHSALKVKSKNEGIPVEELLWMTVATPTTSARMSGIGDAPVGPVEGTEVFGYFRDPGCQIGVVVATIGGIEHKTDSSRGFSDPNGQYPSSGYIGQQDVNKLARNNSLNDQYEPVDTGDVGKMATSNQIQDANTGVAVNPDDTPAGDYIADDDPNFTIEKMLAGDEGIKPRVYWDTEGYPTIGIGHLIIFKKTKDMTLITAELSKQVGRQTSGTITSEEISMLFKQDLTKVQTDIVKNSKTRPSYIKMNRSRQMAMENMAFQLGVGGLAGFPKTLKYLENEDYENAYKEMKNSLWASQTPGRSNRVSRIILTGNLESYGVMVPKDEPKSLSAMAVTPRSSNADASPEDPFTPEDTRIMFKEPETSYNAQYPYNHVYESESGHIQEFDDTPGSERYRIIHPAGTYTEIRPDGGRVIKIQGDDFLITQSGRNVNIKGNLKVVIEGDAQIYNMGNVSQTIDGNVNEFIRGNVKQTIEGELRSEVKQNADIIVQKDLNVTVNQNMTAEIKENATVNVGEKAIVTAKNADMTVEETFNMTGKIININGRTVSIDGSQLTKITGGTVQVG